MAQAAASPKAVLSGTQTAAVSSVSLIAASASGSEIPLKYSRKPSPNASAKTTISGRTRKTARNSSAAPVRAARIQADSESGSRTGALGADEALVFDSGEARSVKAAPSRPPLQQVDRQQQDERCDQHQRGDDGRAGVVELFELDDDQQRQDLGRAWHVPGNEDDRPVFPDCPGEGEGEAGQQGRQ